MSIVPQVGLHGLPLALASESATVAQEEVVTEELAAPELTNEESPVEEATTTDPPAEDTTSETITEPLSNPSADLSITVDDGADSYVPGASSTYTLTVSNNGPSDVFGATVSSGFSSMLTDATWTATGSETAGFAAEGSGDVNDEVILPAGTSIIYIATADVSADATGDLVVLASVAEPGDVTDPDTSNNSTFDTNVLGASDPEAATAQQDDVQYIVHFVPGSASNDRASALASANGQSKRSIP
ncbi:MAG: DUF11 domain-containing protein, partial [Acidimicrobiia bacterium]|nr:DUF11 domain-containing protein [Acidimicrobiia bacterium]